MYMYTQGHSRIVSTGAYLPEKKVTSMELLKEIDTQNRFGIPYDWLDKAMGIHERRVAPEDQLPSDMATEAARVALDMADMKPTQLDAIIFTGVDRDYLEPATAHIVQNKLGAHNAVAFDVTNACHGFMNGIHLMDSLIATGQVRRGLVVTGEHAHRMTDRAVAALKTSNDRELFLKLAGGLTLGDAGAAMIMGPKLGPDSGFMGFMLQSQGQFSHLCTCGNYRGQDTALETDMSEIVLHGIRLLGDMYTELMAKLNWQPEQISKFVHHQVGLKVFKHHARYAGISTKIMPNTITSLGNLVSANIPVAFYNIMKNKEVSAGDKIFVAGAGSGLAVSQAGLIWDAA